MDLLKEILKQVAEHPGATEILEKANSGEISVMEAALLIQQLIEGTDTANSLIAKMDALEDMEIDPDKLIYRHPNGEESMNPLLEARIKERLTQDGDIPELRVGPLPKGARPAVPVQTNATNPLILGMQLQKARIKVERLLEQQTQAYYNSYKEGLILGEFSPPIELPEIYELGKPALPIRADNVGVNELLSLTGQEKRSLVHSCIGTTQGRVSCVTPIRELIRDKLEAHNIKEKVVSSVDKLISTWTYQSFGPEDISEDFNPIEIAAESLFKDLITKKPDVKELYFDIKPINGYSDRVFGWRATFNF